mmetsp:Transcript_21936/g.47350  ORF Transcript_21936/g.47350 Transcript_21936/m.47350 type:complete len:242 (-) Transcript_21936:974-1699(-)
MQFRLVQECIHLLQVGWSSIFFFFFPILRKSFRGSVLFCSFIVVIGDSVDNNNLMGSSIIIVVVVCMMICFHDTFQFRHKRSPPRLSARRRCTTADRTVGRRRRCRRRRSIAIGGNFGRRNGFELTHLTRTELRPTGNGQARRLANTQRGIAVAETATEAVVVPKFTLIPNFGPAGSPGTRLTGCGCSRQGLDNVSTRAARPGGIRLGLTDCGVGLRGSRRSRNIAHIRVLLRRRGKRWRS